MKLYSVNLMFTILYCLCGNVVAAESDKPAPDETQELFRELDHKTQEVKLRILDLNRDVNKYAFAKGSKIAQNYKGKNRANYSLDLVIRDHENKKFLSAINRYHAGRDLGVILSHYETALRVANIYLDYGLYQYSKKIFSSLLGDEDSAVASLARYYLARHSYVKQYWDEALKDLESVTDGIPADLLDQKRIMQSNILQQQKRHDEAIKVLSDVPTSSKYHVYARFNMAMSFLRKGWWTDAEENINAVLQGLKPSDEINRSLIDRLYIALGYSQLQREYYREAYTSLKKVSPEGMYGYKAQLGLSIVSAEQENYKEALNLLNGLLKSYSKQLVTEEAYIVMPFILESIGSMDKTLKYYINAVEYFEKSVDEIDKIQRKVEKGNYDSYFQKTYLNERKAKSNYPSASEYSLVGNEELGNRFLLEVEGSGQWREASRNYSDLDELIRFAGKLEITLKESGNYQAKRYKKLKGKISQYSKNAVNLKKSLEKYLRKSVQRHLESRKTYFASYMNQSKYARARIYDMALGSQPEAVIASKTITDADVRTFYLDYLSSANKAAHNRRTAMARLAALEMAHYDQMQGDESHNTAVNSKGEKSLAVSIELMNNALQDYPEHKDNDKLLYQLIVAYDKQQQRQLAITAMRQLVDNYPQSRFYTEIQFKLGENYLTGNEAIDAELAYSAAIQSGDKNSIFYRRAIYKRGWARLQQNMYPDALDDFFEVMDLSEYTEQGELNAAEKNLYDDVLRAVSLCFSNMGGVEKLGQYFKNVNNKSYAHLAYESLGDMYDAQGRLNDAVNTYNAYLENYGMQPHAPQFLQKIIKAWKNAHKLQKELEARTLFETKYTINSPFWEKNNIQRFANIRKALESNVIYMAEYYHGSYQKNKNTTNLMQAKYWYEKFNKYADTSQKSRKIYFMYAELLSDAGEVNQALAYYEKADQGKAVTKENRETLYAKLVTADKIAANNKGEEEKKKWLMKKVGFAVEFVTAFPEDKRSPGTLINAVENLYKQRLFAKAIEVIERVSNETKLGAISEIALYRAHCLFALNEFKQAETIYTELYGESAGRTANKTVSKNSGLIADRLASTIYKQGEKEEKAGNALVAVEHYLRVAEKVPASTYASIAEYDAAKLLIAQKEYEKSERILIRFQKTYPGHKLQTKVTNKLAFIYSNMSDKNKIALAYENVYQDLNNDATKRRSYLLQAAQVYEEIGNSKKAIELYEKFTTKYPDYHESSMEAFSRLAGLYENINNHKKQTETFRRMVDAEARIRFDAKTERTKYLAAEASLSLIELKFASYQKMVIEEPLKVTLKNKKEALKNLVDELTRISNYGLEETTTQAIFRIAEAYSEFGTALLKSQRPGHLNDIELEQYELLLEEQAYPFEEKALGFYKENLKNIKSGVYNQWTISSLDRLAKLVPGRYKRKEKLDSFINIPLSSLDVAKN